MHILMTFHIFDPPHTRADQNELRELVDNIPFEDLKKALKPVLEKHGIEEDFNIDIETEFG